MACGNLTYSGTVVRAQSLNHIEHAGFAQLKDKQTIRHLPSTSRHLGGLSDQIRLYMH